MQGMSVIFCGELRDRDRFKKSLHDFIQLQSEGVVGDIVWSTDRGKAAFIPGITVIESMPPKNHTGHIWHQMKHLEVGLDNTRSEYVLKTRPDVHIDPDFIRGLKEACGDKTWIPWYQKLHPYYMADECFYGKRENIEKLVNYCEDYDHKYKIDIGISHVRRFGHAYAYNMIRRHMDGLATDEQLLEHYYSTIKKWFYVHSGGTKFRYWSGKNIRRKTEEGIELDWCCDMKPIEEYDRSIKSI